MNESLSAGELDDIKRRLELREKQLIEELQTGKQSAAAQSFERIAGEAPDAGDASIADVSIDGASAERMRDAEELRDVRDALARIEAGTYGLCQKCGLPIPRDRLRVAPAARYDLQHQQEREEGRIRTPTL
jgi:DnaK suppressor protein